MTHPSLNLDSQASLTSCLNTPWFQIPISLTASQIKSLLDSLDQSVLFDSGAEQKRGHFDIVSGNPLEIHRVDKEHPLKKMPIYSRPFTRTRLEIPENYKSLPFVCGMIGFCSYEFGAQLTIDMAQSLTSSRLPSAFFAHYTWSYVYDRQNKQGFVSFSPECLPEARRKIIHCLHNCLIEPVIKQDNNVCYSVNWHKKQDFSNYLDNFNQALDYIEAGDCYQVNLAQQFESDFAGKASDLYFHLRKNLNTPYSSFFAFDEDQHILCFSPEQFIGIQQQKIKTSPIKGTAKNTDCKNNALNLENSLKNQAENLMIVDLMRNDLSKVCQLNTVKVNQLFKLETYKNVHHLVSEIEGVLKAEFNEIEAFFACFPGGSITGAPKKRAMEVINELETAGRDAYCGSVFYWNDDGQFDSNILIRTIVHSENKLYCWGGGGIVHDSLVDEEYQESLFKVANLTGIEE